jgi:diguanylate cyclase (GGDEF)-like protein
MHCFLAIWVTFFLLLPISVCAKPTDAFIEENRQANQLALTAQEQNWIENNGTVTMIGDTTWLPFEGFTEEGRYIGIVAEVVNLIAEKSGLNFEVNKTASWRHSIQFSEGQQVDIISASASNPLLEKNYRATHSTIKSPIVIIARDSAAYIPELSTITDLRVAIVRGAGYGNIIKKSYPEIDFIEVEEINDGLIGVAENQYDLVLMSMMVASYQMAELGLYDLRIAGITDLEMELTLFVNRNKPILWHIIDKIKRLETKQERHQILSKWANNQHVERYSPETVRIFLLLSLFLIVFILHRHYLLKNKDQLFNKLSQRDTLTNMYNRAYLNQIISEEITLSQREGKRFSLIIIDIDDFTQVNKKFGHSIGDRLLQQFALLFDENVAYKATVGRWGAGEFMVICPNEKLKEALVSAEKLRSEIDQAIFINVGKRSACLGVVEYNPPESQDRCLGRLEKTLLSAKQQCAIAK